MMTDSEIQGAREDLAAVFRWSARLNMHEAVSNHFSFAINDEGTKFLVNPAGIHFSRVKASDLVIVDLDEPLPSPEDGGPDPTAAAIHGAMHKNNPQARCVIHLHPKYITALSTLEDPTIIPIDQNTARFYNRVSYDMDFGGMGLGDEATRLSTLLGNRSVVLMGAHGAMTVGARVSDAFDDFYYLERAAETLMTAYASGRKLRELDHDVAETTAHQWENYSFDLRQAHLDQIKAILDEEEPEFRH
ncbi:MAG: class II aldolase/adducin family protein [Alphaproteobacteria bacterium]